MKIWMPGTLTERKCQPTEQDNSTDVVHCHAEFDNGSVFGCSYISTANKGHSIHGIEENLTRTRDHKEYQSERRTQTCEWETSRGPCTTRLAGGLPFWTPLPCRNMPDRQESNGSSAYIAEVFV